MKLHIKPFVSVGNIQFGQTRDHINRHILNKYQFETTEDKHVITHRLSITDYFDNGLMLSYFNNILSCVTINPPCEVFFENVDLLTLNYLECKKFLLSFDNDIVEEEYVGFTSYNLGIAIYAPDATEDPKTSIECITIGTRGYFEQEKMESNIL